MKTQYDVYWAVRDVVRWIVYQSWVVQPRTVYDVVGRAVVEALSWTGGDDPPHPSLDDFMLSAAGTA